MQVLNLHIPLQICSTRLIFIELLDLKENAEVKLPQPCDASTESSINVLKNRILEVFRDYKKENCDQKGNQKGNLDPLEAKGYKSLKKRIQEGELVALKTDKSGRLPQVRPRKSERG